MRGECGKGPMGVRRTRCPELEPPAGLTARRLAGRSDLAILSFPLGDRRELTLVEHQIVDAILVGRRNADIARERGTSPRTIANQIAGIYAKLGVRSRAELVAHSALLGGRLVRDES
jgi:DNA-binding CsgD family transcriptional regulator